MDNREWFSEKAARNPEYIAKCYIPALEKLREKFHLALHEADRKGTLEDIRYRSGMLDGVQEVLGLIAGLRMSEGKPAESGLVTRILETAAQRFGIPTWPGNAK